MALLGTASSCPEGINHAGKREDPKCAGVNYLSFLV